MTEGGSQDFVSLMDLWNLGSHFPCFCQRAVSGGDTQSVRRYVGRQVRIRTAERPVAQLGLPFPTPQPSRPAASSHFHYHPCPHSLGKPPAPHREPAGTLSLQNPLSEMGACPGVSGYPPGQLPSFHFQALQALPGPDSSFYRLLRTWPPRSPTGPRGTHRTWAAGSCSVAALSADSRELTAPMRFGVTSEPKAGEAPAAGRPPRGHCEISP